MGGICISFVERSLELSCEIKELSISESLGKIFPMTF